jgi:hypothetical protein
MFVFISYNYTLILTDKLLCGVTEMHVAVCNVPQYIQWDSVVCHQLHPISVHFYRLSHFVDPLLSGH